MKIMFAFTLPNGVELKHIPAFISYRTHIDKAAVSTELYELEKNFWMKQPSRLEGFSDEIGFRAIRGFDVSGNRNWCVNRGVSNFVRQTEDYLYDFDVLVFVDSDISFIKLNYEMLLEDHRDFPDAVIGGCYRDRKGDAFTAGWFNGKTLSLSTSGFHPVDYTGAGFSIVPKSVFQKLQFPWYWTFYEDIKVPDGTPEGRSARCPVADDIYFCKQCQGEHIGVYTDADIILKHSL